MNLIQKEIHEKAVLISKNFRKLETELIQILKEVDDKHVYLALGYSSLYSYAHEALGLSESNSYTFMSIARKSKSVPLLQEKIESGAIAVSTARRILPVLTPQNQNEWIEKAETLSRSELEKEVVKVNPEIVRESTKRVAEDRISLKLGISEELFLILKRAQTLISNQKRKPVSLEEVLEETLHLYIEKKDPLEKAKRSKSQLVHAPVAQSGRKPIHASLKHQVQLRDHGQCAYRSKDGVQCQSPHFPEIHHRLPVHSGGAHTLENLITLCHRHHSFWHSSENKPTQGLKASLC